MVIAVDVVAEDSLYVLYVYMLLRSNLHIYSLYYRVLCILIT